MENKDRRRLKSTRKKTFVGDSENYRKREKSKRKLREKTQRKESARKLREKICIEELERIIGD